MQNRTLGRSLWSDRIQNTIWYKFIFLLIVFCQASFVVMRQNTKSKYVVFVLSPFVVVQRGRLQIKDIDVTKYSSQLYTSTVQDEAFRGAQ